MWRWRGPDLRLGRFSRAGNCRGRMGDRDRFVDVGPARARTLIEAEVPQGISNAERVATGARTVRPAHEVRRTGRGAGLPRCPGFQRVRPACRPARRGCHRRHHAHDPAQHGGVLADDGARAGRLDPCRPAAGANRPDLAERSAYTGLLWVFGYMCGVAAIYLLFPGVLVRVFEGEHDPESFAAVAAIVPTLLAYVAVYSLADAVNVTFSFALRGAGDTRFVSLLTFALAWPIMVVPTFVVVRAGGSIYAAWVFATAYIIAMAVCFFLRFRTGKWKTMRVIEGTPIAVLEG